MRDPDRSLSADEAAAAEREILAAREAWGPEWPSWLSMNEFDPQPEAEI
jgi:hypothetical protein